MTTVLPGLASHLVVIDPRVEDWEAFAHTGEALSLREAMRNLRQREGSQ